MKKNIYSNIFFCAVLLFLCTAFAGNAQVISITTSPSPIPRNGSFTVTVNISDAPTNGTDKDYLFVITCSECTPTSQTYTGIIPAAISSGSFTSPSFTSPDRPGNLAIGVSVNKTAGPGACATGTPCVISTSGTLPVKLVHFSLSNVNSSVNLSWQTSTELNNEKFIVETSTEGEVFNRIGEIAGAGTTTEPQNYTFTHQTPSTGVNYYRLKQVDFDGTFEYSKVIAINAVGNDKIFAFPNPAKDQLNIQYDQSKGSAALFLFDAMGRKIDTTVGGYAGYYEAKLPSDLPAGTYWLRVIRSGKVQTLPIVKQ